MFQRSIGSYITECLLFSLESVSLFFSEECFLSYVLWFNLDICSINHVLYLPPLSLLWFLSSFNCLLPTTYTGAQISFTLKNRRQKQTISTTINTKTNFKFISLFIFIIFQPALFAFLSFLLTFKSLPPWSHHYQYFLLKVTMSDYPII